MRTSLLIVHRKTDKVIGKYLRVRLPTEPYQGDHAPDAKFIPAHKIGVEQHGPGGVIRSSQHVPDRVHVGGWMFDCIGQTVTPRKDFHAGVSALKRLQDIDVDCLDLIDTELAQAQAAVKSLLATREIYLAEAASRARTATRKDVQP